MLSGFLRPWLPVATLTYFSEHRFKLWDLAALEK